MDQDFSYWEYDTYHRLWDVCIVGAGINGLLTGISILEKAPDAKVLVIDRWFIPLGASTRNAGFSCFGSPSEILDDIAQMGEDAALSLVEKRWRGLQKLISRLQSSPARYEHNGGYEVYHRRGYDALADKILYLNRMLGEVTGNKNVFEPCEVP